MTALRSPHTPGPWEITEHTTRVAVRPAYGGKIVAHTGVTYDSMQRPQALANAQLIAAAPELLEALQDMLALEEGEETDGFRKQDWLRKAKRRGQIIERARAAIAKATGEQP